MPSRTMKQALFASSMVQAAGSGEGARSPRTVKTRADFGLVELGFHGRFG